MSISTAEQTACELSPRARERRELLAGIVAHCRALGLARRVRLAQASVRLASGVSIAAGAPIAGATYQDFLRLTQALTKDGNNG